MHEFLVWLSGNSVGAIVFIAIIALAVITFVLILIVAFAQDREIDFWPPHIGSKPQTQKSRKKPPAFTHDVFLSSPMAAYANDDEYKRDREAVFRIIEAMRTACGYNVSYAGHDIHSLSDFDAPDISIAADLDALDNSRLFIMLYPRKLVSSVLVEAGIAMARGKPSVYFIRHRDDLPYLLRYPEQAPTSVKIYEAETTDEIINLIKRNKKDLFCTVRKLREPEEANEIRS
jgi:hypothetical protein